MNKKMLLFTALCITTLSLLTMWGCGGGGGGGSSASLKASDSAEGLAYSAYVFVPDSSGQSLFKLYNLADTTTADGLLVLDSAAQAPSGYVPLVGCKVTLPDGTEASTDASGRFQFARIPFTSSEKGMPLLIDPEGSNYPRFARVIVPLIVPRLGAAIPPDAPDLRLVVKPASVLLPLGARFLYHAFLVDDSTGALYQVPAGTVNWSVDSVGGIGTILPDGLFRSANLGTGQVVATATINSAKMTASGDVEVVDNQQVARIYGQVTDVSQYPITGVIIFVSGFENGVITNGQGNYLFPRVPTGESLSLTLIYRGIIVKTLNDVVVADGEAKEINVSLDTFRETGKISYRPGQGQTSEDGRLVLAVEGLAGPLSTDEFPATKEFELLKVDEVKPDLYIRLQEDPSLSVPVLVEGKPLFSSADYGHSLPQVEVTTLQIVPEQPGVPVQTMQGEVSWPAGQGQEGIVSFRTEPRNPKVAPMQFVLNGLENFPRILAKLQGSSGTWFSAKLIGQVDRTNWRITLLEISLIDTFFQGEGKVYYDPQFGSKGAVLMEISSGSDPAAGQNNLTRPYLVLNVESVSTDIYKLLTSSADRKFPASVSGVEVDDPDWDEYDCQPLKVSQIQIYSDTDDYLLHRLGKIWRDDQGQIQFVPSLSLSGNGAGYYLLGVEQFDEILTPLRRSPGTAFSCYLSGRIQGPGGSEISLSQLEILSPAVDPEETGAGPRPDGFTYYVDDNSTPLGGKYLYQKFLPDGSIDESKMYELSNITRGTYSDTADLLKDNPGLIVQIILNATDFSSQSGAQNPFGTTRLTVNSMTVLDDADPLLKISGNLIYHSWENVLEMVATSPAFPRETFQSFILKSVPDTVLSQLLNHPDRFVPVSGIIQVFQPDRRSSLEPLTAKALDLTIMANLN